MLTARERRYLTVYLPLGIAAAIVVDGAAFAAIGGPFLAPGEICAGCPSSTTPLGTVFSLGPPVERTSGAHHWYNFTVQSASDGLVWDQLQIHVVTSTYAPYPNATGWVIEIVGPTGGPIGTYSLASQSWTGGGSNAVVVSQAITLDTGAADLSGQGDALNVIGQGEFDGSISVYVP
jgi:hypothetical protein